MISFLKLYIVQLEEFQLNRHMLSYFHITSPVLVLSLHFNLSVEFDPVHCSLIGENEGKIKFWNNTNLEKKVCGIYIKN